MFWKSHDISSFRSGNPDRFLWWVLWQRLLPRVDLLDNGRGTAIDELNVLFVFWVLPTDIFHYSSSLYILLESFLHFSPPALYSKNLTLSYNRVIYLCFSIKNNAKSKRAHSSCEMASRPPTRQIDEVALIGWNFSHCWQRLQSRQKKNWLNWLDIGCPWPHRHSMECSLPRWLRQTEE